MKKTLILIILILAMVPTTVHAKKFYPKGTDLNIDIDDTEWYVFTRDNLKNNPELEEIGVTYDYLSEFMNNNYVYLDSALFYEDNSDNIELLIRKKPIDDIKNLSNFSNDDVMELAKELSKKQNADIYDIYQTNYKYAYLKYQDSGYYLVEYFTIVNGGSYTVTIQKKSEYTSYELSK